MTAPHQLAKQEEDALVFGAALGEDPGDGGTLDLNGRSSVIFSISGTTTVNMPDEDSTPVGVRVFVTNAAAGTTTIKDNAGSTTLDTCTEDQMSALILTPQKWAALTLGQG